MQVVELGQHGGHRKFSTGPRRQPGHEVGSARQRLGRVEGGLPHQRRQRGEQRVQAVTPAQPTRGIEHRQPCAAQPVFQRGRDLRIGHADRQRALRRAVTPRQLRHPPRLLRRIGAEADLRGKVGQYQRPAHPSLLARAAPLVEQLRAVRRAEHHDIHRHCPRQFRQHAHGQRQRIGCGEQHNARDALRRHRRAGRINACRLRLAPSAHRQHLVTALFQLGELRPALRLRQPVARAVHHIAQPQSVFPQPRLQALQLRGEPGRPGKVALRGIHRKHRAKMLRLRRAQDFHPRELRLQPRRHAGTGGRRQQILRQHDARREHGRVARGRVLRQRLAQPPARLPRRHNHPYSAQIERTGAVPALRQPRRGLGRQRPVPRKNFAADVGGRWHDRP